MSPLDRMMSWAQIVLSALFLIGTFVVIGIYETGHVHLPVDQLQGFNTLLNWLTGAAFLILVFWFQRQRQGGIPDASTVTQTQIAPDGSKVSVTSPAHLPLPSLPNPTTPPSAAK